VDKTLHTISFDYKIQVIHAGDKSLIIQRNMMQVPRRQDIIKLGKEYYTVVGVSWNFADARSVTVLVRNL
jgi:hypothetical protein